MNNKHPNTEQGSSLVITVAVVATILALLASAVSYTQHVSRMASRSRKSAQAMEIADGHLEYLFTNWRNIYRRTWTTVTIGALDASLVGTNYFYTDMYKPGTNCTYNGGACPAATPIPNMTPSATPPVIALPAKANFPSETNYTVTQYRIQAVDPMLTLDANENALVEGGNKGNGSWAAMSPAVVPPAAYGPNTWQYSFFYLAAVDVTVPALTGNVTAKVRRVFEKKFDNPWSYAMFYADDLEFSPTTTFAIDGPIHTNGGLFVSTNNFTTTDSTAYGGEYVNGYSPNDTSSHTGSISAPNFPNGKPPVEVSPYLPFGWDLNMSNSDGSANNDNYHELIETPATGTDALASVRLYNQADYRILIDASNNVSITDTNGTAIVNSGGTKNAYQAITGAITTNQAIQDNREGTYVRLATLNVGTLTTSINNGTLVKAGTNSAATIFYIKDTSTNGTIISSKVGGTGSTVNTTERAVRLSNGATLPSGGLTLVSENPVYIQGNYNTGGSPPSNSGTYTSPTVSGYARKTSAVMGDSINVLSGNWVDTNSTASTPGRVATNTTVNAALVSGQVPSASGEYSGGGENFVRFLEDWSSKTFTYYGSMVELFNSKTATGVWKGSGNTYKPAGLHWYYDTNFGSSSPPGNLAIAAYLQQQRWYQVY